MIGGAWRRKFIMRYQIISPLGQLAGPELTENRLLIESCEGLELFHYHDGNPHRDGDAQELHNTTHYESRQQK